MNYNLKNLCEKYNCDKLDHAYIEIYQKYFVNLKNQELNLLEIGVSDGASIKVWSDFFVNSNVVGIDIKNIDIEKKGLNRKNISIYQGSQSDKSFINKIIFGKSKAKGENGLSFSSLQKWDEKSSKVPRSTLRGWMKSLKKLIYGLKSRHDW